MSGRTCTRASEYGLALAAAGWPLIKRDVDWSVSVKCSSLWALPMHDRHVTFWSQRSSCLTSLLFRGRSSLAVQIVTGRVSLALKCHYLTLRISNINFHPLSSHFPICTVHDIFLTSLGRGKPAQDM